MDSTTVYKIQGNYKGKDIISLDQFSPEDLEILFPLVSEMRKIAKGAMPCNILLGNIITLLFYEPSSRTFGSFSAAVKQLGGQTLEFSNPAQTSSVAKGESLEDTIKTFEAYSDALVIRHPEAGTAEKAAETATSIPIINAGDGIGEHPTQALLDLYTIQEKFGALENLTGVITGDLLNGRTVHSLLRGLSLFKGNKIYLLSPQSLRLPLSHTEALRKRGLTLFEIEKEEELPKDAQFWYWTRVQKERFVDINEYDKVKNMYILTKNLLTTYGNNEMIIMHPLPRIGEILPEVDEDPRAVYLRSQIRNGMYVRMTLLTLILGKNL